MSQRFEIYKCEACGNIAEVLHEGNGRLTCCSNQMKLIEEKTEDLGKEKHVPVIEKDVKGITVKVGATEHPMDEKHYIEWVEILSDNSVYRRYLSPKELPKATFRIDSKKIIAREYCTIHGLWKSK